MKQKRLVSPLTIKSLDDETGKFSGYGSVFDVVDSYSEVVVRGAFNNSLTNRKPALLWQHNSDQPIGVYDVIREDDKGLYVEGRLLKDTVQQAAEAYALLKAGALSGLSIGFSTLKDAMSDDKRTRRLLEVDLWEISLVTFPANDAARIANVKALDGLSVETLHKRKKEIEAALRDAGASDSVARYIAAQIKQPVECDAQGDAETETKQNLQKLINSLKGL